MLGREDSAAPAQLGVQLGTRGLSVTAPLLLWALAACGHPTRLHPLVLEAETGPPWPAVVDATTGRETVLTESILLPLRGRDSPVVRFVADGRVVTCCRRDGYLAVDFDPGPAVADLTFRCGRVGWVAIRSRGPAVEPAP